MTNFTGTVERLTLDDGEVVHVRKDDVFNNGRTHVCVVDKNGKERNINKLSVNLTGGRK